MTSLSDLSPDALRRAIDNPYNGRAVKTALERELASRGGKESPKGENVAQTGVRTRVRAKIRRGVPNQTEERYAMDVLEPWRRDGRILRFEFEAATWHLFNVGTYTPDFLVWLPGGGLWNVEVKGGHVRPQALVRWKAHSAARPWMRWSVIQYKDGAWKTLHDRPAQERGR